MNMVIDREPRPRIGLGCAAPGVMGTPIADRAAHAVIEAAWEHGIRLYDTAALYGGGVSEDRLGADGYQAWWQSMRALFDALHIAGADADAIRGGNAHLAYPAADRPGGRL